MCCIADGTQNVSLDRDQRHSAQPSYCRSTTAPGHNPHGPATPHHRPPTYTTNHLSQPPPRFDMASTSARQVAATLSSVAQGGRLQAAPSAAARASASRTPLTVRAVAAPVREAETRSLTQQASAAAASAAALSAAAAKGRVVLESEDELRSNWEHRGWVGGATLLMAATLAQGLGQVDGAGDVAAVGAAALAAYALSDLGTGECQSAWGRWWHPVPDAWCLRMALPPVVHAAAPHAAGQHAAGRHCALPHQATMHPFPLTALPPSLPTPPLRPHFPSSPAAFYHFFVDNYGDGETPVFGGQIAAFQGHHQRPWTITEREFSNNVHKVGHLDASAWGAALPGVLPFLGCCPAWGVCCCNVGWGIALQWYRQCTGGVQAQRSTSPASTPCSLSPPPPCPPARSSSSPPRPLPRACC